MQLGVAMISLILLPRKQPQVALFVQRRRLADGQGQKTVSQRKGDNPVM